MSKKSIIEGKAESKSISRQTKAKKASNALDTEESENTAPTNVNSYIKGGALFLMLTLGIFTAWGALAPLSSAIIAPGEVIVENYRRTIQHLEGGIIEQIFVRDGDQIQAGAPLVQLQATQWAADQEITRKRLLSTQAELERLFAEQRIIEAIDDKLPTQPLENALVFSKDLLQEAKDDPEIQQVIQQQQQLFRARQRSFIQQQQGLVTRIEQIQQQILGLEEQLIIMEEQIQVTQDEQRAFETLFDEGLGDGQRARDLRRTLLDQQSRAAGTRSEISRLKIQATETQLQLTSTRQGFLRELGEQHKEVQSNFFDLQERFSVTSDALKRSTIYAPDSGTIVDLQVYTLGSIAKPGETLMDIVPDNEAFLIEARVETNDINHIYLGQLADVRFSAFNQRLTKVIEAELVNISADRLTDERSGQNYYLVRLRITENGRSDMNEDMHLKPGMPAEVMIKREDRTLFAYLLKPITDVLARSLTEI